MNNNNINVHSNDEFKARSLNWQLVKQLIESYTLPKDLPYKNLLIVGIYYGLRISDIENLTYGDFIDIEDKSFIVQKKRNKSLKLFNYPEIVSHFKNTYDNYSYVHKNTPILSRPRQQKPISYSTANRYVKRIAVEHNLTSDGSDSNVSTHSLRKTFARMFYEQGGRTDNTLLALSMYFNHDSITTTRIYIGLVDEEVYNILSNLPKLNV